jgi:seryl-tRNA synthetase
MHDINRLRADPAAFDAALQRRGMEPLSANLIDADDQRRSAMTALQDVQSRRNALAQEIGQGKRQKIDTSALEQEASGLRGQIDALEQTARQADGHLKLILETIPNILDADVPDGANETQNVQKSQVGEPTTFSFPAQQHFELGETSPFYAAIWRGWSGLWASSCWICMCASMAIRKWRFP